MKTKYVLWICLFIGTLSLIGSMNIHKIITDAFWDVSIHYDVKNSFTMLQLKSTKDTVLYNIQNCKINHKIIPSQNFNINHKTYANRLFCKYYDYDITKFTSTVLWWISMGFFTIMTLIFLIVCIHVRTKRRNKSIIDTEFFNFTEVIIHTNDYLV